MSRGKKTKKKILRQRREASSVSTATHRDGIHVNASRGGVAGTCNKTGSFLRFPLETSKLRSHHSRSSNFNYGDGLAHVNSCTSSIDRPSQYNFDDLFNVTELRKLKQTLHVTDLSYVPLLLGAVVLEKGDIVRRLLKNGHQVDYSYTEDKSTPLMWAVRNKNLEMINLLMQHDADPTLLDKNMDNVALIAIQSSSWDENDFLDFWKTINYKINLDHSNVTGNTILHYAIKRQWNILVEQILKTEANVNCANVKGVTPLMMAGIRINPCLVSALLRSRADVSREDARGCTALCYSIACSMQKKYEGHHPSLKKLVCAVNTEESNFTIESYLKRRLELLIYPPEPKNNFTSTINSIIRSVFVFFIQYTQSGLKIFLHLDVFEKIREAVEQHMDSWSYLQAVLEILIDLLCYCNCSVNGNISKISQTDLMDLFTTAGLPDTCLCILKRYTADPATNWLVISGLEPIFAKYVTDGKAYKWLKENYHHLEPHYSGFSDKYMTGNDDRRHHFFGNIMEFRHLMTKLKGNDNTLETLPDFGFGKSDESVKISQPVTSSEHSSPLSVGSSKRQRRKIKTLKMKLAKMRGLTLAESKNCCIPKEADSKYFTKSPRLSLHHADTNFHTEYQSSQPMINPELLGRENDSISWKLTEIAKSEEFVPEHLTNFSNFNLSTDNVNSITVMAEDPILDRNKSSVINDEGYTAENVEAIISYLSTLFEEIISSYRKNWQRDRALGYPGYKGAQGDAAAISKEQMKIRTEEIARLNAILPKLEDSCIKKLTDGWLSLISKVCQIASQNAKKFRKIITLLQLHLLTYQVCPKDYFDKTNEKFFTQIGNSDVSQTDYDDIDKKLTAVGDGIVKKTESDFFQQSIAEIHCGGTYESQETQYHLIQSVNTLVDETVSSNNKDETTMYQCCEKNMPNQNKRLINSSDTRSVIYTAQIIEALRTQVTMSSTTCAFGELLQTPNASIFSPQVLQLRTTRATALTLTENPRLVKNHHVPNVYNYPTFWDTPTTQTYVSRWAVLITGLKAHVNNKKQMLGKVVLSTPEQQKHFTISAGGNFGPIELGLDSNGQPLAIRRLDKEINKLVRPLLAPVLALRHSHILPFLIYANDGMEIILGTPLCEYNLGEYLMCLKMSKELEQRSLILVKQFLAGLSFLHNHNMPITHGNIKPSNLMIDRAGVLRLAEFGLWKSLYRDNPPPSSSIIWFSRESYKTYKEEDVFCCTCATDIQVAGMIMHFILTGGLHPYGTETSDILENIAKGYPKLQCQGCEIIDLISWMLVFDPLSRPSINQILMHIFFWDIDKKWSFLLTCAGITTSGTTISLPLDAFQKDLEAKAISDQVKGDWLSIVQAEFPTLMINKEEYSDSPTGLLLFVRRLLESQPAICQSVVQQFILKAFPVLPLSLYRLLETTHWLSHPVFSPFMSQD